MENTSIRLRCYPNQELKQTLAQWFGNARDVFNWGIELRRKNHERWVKKGKPDNYNWENFYTLAGKLTDLKKGAREYLQLSPAQTLVEALRHCERAFTNCFQHGFGYPRFKRKHDKQSLSFPPDSIKSHHLEVTGGYLYVKLPKTENSLKVRLHRELPEGRLIRTNISKNRAGEYFISLLYEVEDGYYLKYNPDAKKVVGIDLNANKNTPLVTAWKGKDGEWREKILGKEEKERLRRLEARRKRYQRKAAKQHALWKAKIPKPNKKTGEIAYPSRKNLDKTYTKIAKLYQKETNQRENFAQQLSAKLAKNFTLIKWEDIDLRGITAHGGNRKRKMNHGMVNLGFGRLRDLTERKAGYYGHSSVKVSAKFTSQRCSKCGHISRENRQSQSRFKCVECGFKLHADRNAARNICSRRPKAA